MPEENLWETDKKELEENLKNKKVRVIIRGENKPQDDEITDEYVLACMRNMKRLEKRILDLVYRMRMMNTSDIKMALGVKSNDKLYRALRELHANRFLERKQKPVEVKMNGDRELYHMLDVGGAKFIKIYYGHDRLSDVKWLTRENEVKYDYAKHGLMISHFYALLEKEAREKGIKITQGQSDKHLQFEYTVKSKKLIMSPDLYVELVKDDVFHRFLVEIDMGTMSYTGKHSSNYNFDGKVEKYETFEQNGLKTLGIDNMPKVLVITTSKERAEKLAEVVRIKQSELGSSRVNFYFSCFSIAEKSVFGKGYITQNYSVENKAHSLL